MPSGYAPEQIGFWWVAVGMTLVVTLVASILLQLLITLVKDINNWVGQIIETLGATAQNTEQAYRIGEVAQAVDAILNEGLRKQALENTKPLHDLETTTDIAVTVTRELNRVRMSLEG